MPTTYQSIGLMYAAVALVAILVLILDSRRRKTLDINSLPLSRFLIWLIRIMVGVLFIYSGFVKANDYIGFAYKLEEYFVVFGEHFSALEGFFKLFIPLAEPMAWFISVFEIALGVAIIVGWRMVLSTWLALIMMIFFTVLTGYSHFTGAVTDCGCFGDALKLEPWESFTKDIILTAILIPLFLVKKYIKPFPNATIATVITLASFLISGAYSYYCHENLPVVDYRAYKVGVDLNICTTEALADGIPACKDWYVYFPSQNDSTWQEPELFSGEKLILIAYDLTKASEDGLKKSISLANNLASTSMEIHALTATGPSELEKLQAQYEFPYSFGFVDQTVLKTIVRSNPGYMLLRDGVILKKWHHNNTPSGQEIRTLLGK